MITNANRRRHARRMACVASALLAALGIACEPRHAPSADPAPVPAAVRTFAERPLDTLWTRSFDDSALATMPEYLAADDAHVYVGDVPGRAVLALDARTGTLRWDARDRGDTSALRAPRSFGARRAGGLLVFDADRRAIVALASDGRVVARTPLPPLESVRGACEASDSTYLIAAGGLAGSMLVVTRSGRPLGVRPLPWPDLRARSALVSAALLTPTPTGCVSALVFGRGMSFFEQGTFQPPLAYVEPAPLLDVVVTRRVEHGDTIVSESLAEHVLSAIDLAATSSEVLVAFDGRSRDRAHVIDVYDAHGAYRSSIRTSRRVDAMAASSTTLFVLTTLGGQPTLVALRRPGAAR